jgi:hypothetical protein
MYGVTGTGGPPQRGRRSAFLRRHGQGLGASGDLLEEEPNQPHGQGKRRVKITERAK